LEDRRVRFVRADAFDWLRDRVRSGAAPFDVVISALAAPRVAGPELYSQEFYGLAARVLAEEGRLAVRAGAPAERVRAFWTVHATLRAAELSPCPYPDAADDAGFLLARHARPAPQDCDPAGGRTASLPQGDPRARPSTLMHPRYPG
ncbi:spermidine synthase, partial [Streptomyces nanshensis]